MFLSPEKIAELKTQLRDIASRGDVSAYQELAMAAGLTVTAPGRDDKPHGCKVSFGAYVVHSWSDMRKPQAKRNSGTFRQ